MLIHAKNIGIMNIVLPLRRQISMDYVMQANYTSYDLSQSSSTWYNDVVSYMSIDGEV